MDEDARIPYIDLVVQHFSLGVARDDTENLAIDQIDADAVV